MCTGRDSFGVHVNCKKREIALFAVCKWGIIISSRIKPAAYLYSAGEIKEEVLCYESEC